MKHPAKSTASKARAAAAALALTAFTALTALTSASAYAQTAGGFQLITADEVRQNAQAELSAPPQITPRQVGPKGNVPGIKVVSPAAPGTPVAAPLRIEVAFTPTPGTRIVPSSFRVLYGLLKIDLTERLKPHAAVTETGVVIDRAVVPNGQHSLILQVADDQGNTAEQELRIRVGSAS